MKVIIIISILLLNSCNKKKSNNQIEDVIDIINIAFRNKDNQLVEIEKYIYRATGDTINNQYKYYNSKNEIDPSKSKYYEINDLFFDVDSTTKGVLHFHSEIDGLKKIESRKIEFSFLQKSKDSLFYKSYNLDTDTGSVIFEYNNFDRNSIYGYIREVVTIDTTDTKGKKMIRVIESITLVDNKNPTKNPYDLRN